MESCEFGSQLEMGISDLAYMLNSQLSGYQRSTRDDIASMESSLRLKIRSYCSDLAADVHRLRSESTHTTNALQAAIGDIERSIRSSVDRLQRQNNLIVTGVPHAKRESLMRYFHAWCDTLGYTKCDVPLATLKRLPRRAGRSGSSAIILSFALNSQRNEFFSRYLRTCTLSLRSIGFLSYKRIYVNEDLGPSERKLRMRALRMKRNGDLHSVSTRQGFVYIKLTSSHNGIAVTSNDMLDQLLKNKLSFP